MADPGREFAFVIPHLGRDMTKWSYRFETASDHTIVTESFEMIRDMPWYFRVADRVFLGVADRKADLEKGIESTLQRLKVASENPDAAR